MSRLDLDLPDRDEAPTVRSTSHLNESITGPRSMKSIALIVSAAVAASGLPAAAQTLACTRLSEQLLKQLGTGPSQTLEARSEQQRQVLRTQNCDPQATGYDVEAESIKLNKQLGKKTEEKVPFSFGKMINIQY
ncbi:hypothetical protein [Synechococcus sp. RedBA-s]|uniref:hypothetical protein n=1 Tax=Synechococcus sp. RedBA-s TaxID=2823741 RepID=UPI0020CEFEB4|nr:hypothetical protein [Synechococcus sp. RedBA-s]MCP9800832.1 hypothetical protein [Synechococcus sp. RedBA-s]